MKMFKCQACMYVTAGDAAPDPCPRCGAPRDKFTELAPEDAARVERARPTNQYHKELAKHLEQVHRVALRGIEDNLDPACAAIFSKARDAVHGLLPFINAEIEMHVKKGKWG